MLRLVLPVLALTLCGCVAAYDPSSPSRLGLETRAQEVGVKDSMPWTRGRRAQPQPSPQPNQQAAAQLIPPRPAPPSDPLVQPVEPLVAAPATPAGQQLDWWLTILRGADTRRIGSHFTDTFLTHVPVAQLREVARLGGGEDLADGPVELIPSDDAPPPPLTAVIRGTASDRYTRIKLGVDAKGQISTLWLGPLVGFKRADLDTWAKIDSRCNSLEGVFSFGAYELNGTTLRPIHTLNDSRPLAIGSAFKLYILGALAEEIAAGRARWDEPLAINDELKSLPSGQMQLEPEGQEFPISRYAELMISISDNTAADHLLHRIGRAKVEAYMARLNPDAGKSLPFLSTMEMFKLKLSPDRTLADRYARADTAARRAMLAEGGEVARAVPSFAGAALWKAPYEIERIEWFASAGECCRVMADLHRLEQQSGMQPLSHALRINPGLQFDAKVWPSVAYKGGSEPGVLNMTWLLTREDGKLFLVSIGWNNTKKEVDLKQAADLAGAGVALVAEEGEPVK